MGVTLHFEGRLKGDTALARVVEKASTFAAREGWKAEKVHKANVTLHRVQDEKDVDYQGPVTGIVVFPHVDAEPLHLEFDRTLYVQDFIKTQFAPLDVHIKVVELLRLLESDFERLVVVDEGQFWDSSDVQLLRGHVDTVHRVLRKLLAENPRRHGPVRLASGRIADYVS